MGFLTPEPLTGPHFCPKPEEPKRLPAGTRWQCDDCGAIHRVEMVWDRNTMNLEWVLKQPAEPKPKCNAPIKRCVMAGEHQPVCRCVLDAGHDAGHLSTH